MHSHPYKERRYYEEPTLPLRTVAILRLLATGELLLGFTITAIEAVVYLLEGDPSYPLSSAVGVWSGITVILCGVFALLSSRPWSSESRTRCVILCHAAFAALGTVNTLFVFIIRCMNAPVIPLSGYFNDDTDDSSKTSSTPSPISWSNLQILKYTSLVLYVIGFMVLGMSVGMSMVAYRSIVKPQSVHGEEYVNQETVIVAHPQDETVEREKEKVRLQIEAAANGLYRRLEEEDDDD